MADPRAFGHGWAGDCHDTDASTHAVPFKTRTHARRPGWDQLAGVPRSPSGPSARFMLWCWIWWGLCGDARPGRAAFRDARLCGMAQDVEAGCADPAGGVGPAGAAGGDNRRP